MPCLLVSRFNILFCILLLFAVCQGQSLIKFVCQRNPTLDFCPFSLQNRRQPTQGPWVTPPPIPHIYHPLNGQSSRTAVPEHHEHISSFHSSRHRIAEPSESMQEEDEKQMNSQLNTPTRFSSKNGANEDKTSFSRRLAMSQELGLGGSGNSDGVGVGSGLGIGIPGVGPVGVSSSLGVGVPGLGGGSRSGVGGGGLFGIGSSTGVRAPFVGNIGVSSGLGIG